MYPQHNNNRKRKENVVKFVPRKKKKNMDSCDKIEPIWIIQGYLISKSLILITSIHSLLPCKMIYSQAGD
jgi:hypothetical protein